MHLLTLAFAVLAFAAPVALATAPVPGEPVLVVAAPWAGPDAALRIVFASDGRVVAASGGGGVALARSEAPGFAGRLRREGALLAVRAAPAPCGRES